MENAMELAKVMGPVYAVLGLSMLFYGGAWKELVKKYAGDHFAMLAMMMMYMVLGLISLNMYSSWEWNVWILVTITGWALFLKGVVYFLLPGAFTKNMMMKANCKTMMVVGGLIVTVIGAALTYYSYWA